MTTPRKKKSPVQHRAILSVAGRAEDSVPEKPATQKVRVLRPIALPERVFQAGESISLTTAELIAHRKDVVPID